jgi:initiation factor 1A
MVKNTTGGKGHKNAKRVDRNKVGQFNDSDGDMFYAQIEKILCDNRVQVKRSDLQICQVIIPGRFRKRVWLKLGDFVVIKSDEICWKVVEAGELAKANQLFNINAEDNTGLVFGENMGESESEDDDIKKMCVSSFKKKDDDNENKKEKELPKNVKSIKKLNDDTEDESDNESIDVDDL